MNETYVNKETLIGEIVTQYPEACEILFSIGMHCLGCPSARSESLADACMVHGFDPEQGTDAINRKIAESRA